MWRSIRKKEIIATNFKILACSGQLDGHWWNTLGITWRFCSSKKLHESCRARNLKRQTSPCRDGSLEEWVKHLDMTFSSRGHSNSLQESACMPSNSHSLHRIESIVKRFWIDLHVRSHREIAFGSEKHTFILNSIPNANYISLHIHLARVINACAPPYFCKWPTHARLTNVDM